MSDCPNLDAAGGCRLLESYGVRRVGRVVCDRCRATWPNAEPPATIDASPVLSMIAAANTPSPKPIGDPPPADASIPAGPRGECDFLGRVIDRKSCACHRRHVRRCEYLEAQATNGGRTTLADCDRCPHWRPAGCQPFENLE